MSPSCVLSSHLARQFATSWKEMRHPLDNMGQTSPGSSPTTSYFHRASSPTASDNGKYSLDSERGHSSASGASMTRTNSNSSWKWGTR